MDTAVHPDLRENLSFTNHACNLSGASPTRMPGSIGSCRACAPVWRSSARCPSATRRRWPSIRWGWPTPLLSPPARSNGPRKYAPAGSAGLPVCGGYAALFCNDREVNWREGLPLNRLSRIKPKRDQLIRLNILQDKLLATRPAHAQFGNFLHCPQLKMRGDFCKPNIKRNVWIALRFAVTLPLNIRINTQASF